MRKFIVSLAAFAMTLGVGTSVADAQYQQGPPQLGQQSAPPQGGDASQAPDPAAPGVARLSFISGEVSTQTGDSSDWAAATLNTPISVNDRVATANNGRAELQIDAANDLRMSASATAKIASLNRTNIQVQVGQGLVTYSVLRGSEANSEIDTPNAAIHPNGPGEYRILVNSDAETQVIVRQGSAEVSTPDGSTHVDAGQLITVAGADNPQYRTEAAPGRDEWDAWNADRDRRIENASSWGKTDRYYTGSEDLDGHGTWTEVPDYGQVWVPSQGPDWAPYRDGRWVYEPYYGWTWVSYEPWGWAPYHYGRWFVYGGSWAWWPGPVYGYSDYYPVWAPAYVSFFGFGGGGLGFGAGFGFGGGFGRYGWLPCGPGDWYHPWYGRWGGRENFVSLTNIHNNFHEGFGPLGGNRGRQFSNLDEAMRNDRVRGGISSMGGNEFGRGAVSAHQDRISESSFRQSSLVSGRMPVNPSRESFSPSGRNANPSAIRNTPPASQHFFSGTARANAGMNGANNASRNQSSFNGNRNGGSFDRASPQGGSAAISNRANGAVAESNRGAWRTFTPPQSANTGRSAQGLEQNSRGANIRSSGNTNGNPTSQNRQTFSSPSRGSIQSDRGNWQHFNRPSSPAQSQTFDRSGSSQSQQVQRGASSQPQQFERGGPPQSQQYEHGGYPQSPQYDRGGYSQSRQQLNMRQPVVTPRTYSAPRQTYNAPRPSYGVPGGGGSSAPRGNSGGGGSSPRGGGGGGSGHSGGGGGHSR